LELVSCCVRKNTNITVSAGQNALVFRIGLPETSDQYQAEVPLGSYSPTSLAETLQIALNNATPMPAYRSWRVQYLTGASPAFQILHAGIVPPAGPNAIDFFKSTEQISIRGKPVYSYFAGQSISDTTVEGFPLFAQSQVLPDNPDTLAYCMDTPNDPRDLVLPTQVYASMNAAVHPQGEVSLTVRLERGYSASEIDGVSTPVSENRFKLVSYPGDPWLQGDEHMPVIDGISITAQTVSSPYGAPYNQLYTMHFPWSKDTKQEILFKGKNRNFHFRILSSGIMKIDLTEREPDGTPLTDTKGFYYMQANTDYRNANARRVGRWESVTAGLNGERTYLYVNDQCLLFNSYPEHTTAVSNQGSLKYKVNTIGVFNHFSGNTAQPGFGDTSFTKRQARYKILRVNTQGEIQKFVVIDPGEGFQFSDPPSSSTLLNFDDPATFVDDASNPGTILANCSSLNLGTFQTSPALISTNLTRAGNQFSGGFLMRTSKLYPHSTLGIARKEMVEGTYGLNDPEGNRLGDLAVAVEPGGPTPFRVSVYQWQQTDPDVSVGGLVPLIDGITYTTWNTLNTTGTPPAVWTQYSGFESIKVTIQTNVFNLKVFISHEDAGNPGQFIEQRLLCETGDNIDGRLFEQTLKERMYPLFPVYSLHPNGALGGAFRYAIDGTFEPIRETLDPQGHHISYRPYQTMVGAKVQTNDQYGPGPIADVDLPRIMLKARPLETSAIVGGVPGLNEIVAEDYDPARSAVLGVLLNLDSVYNCVQGAVGQARVFTGTAAAVGIPFLGSYAIEIANLPIEGVVGKNYGLNGERIGIGTRNAILHIVPAEQQDDDPNATVQLFTYKAQFGCPVDLKLASESSLYDLHFRLRNIESGELLQDLIHPTQIIFKVTRANKSQPYE